MRLRNIPEAKEIVAGSRFVVQKPEEQRGRWRTFTGGRPLSVEIGTGKGRFLMEMAAREPETAFLGVERYESVLLRAVEKMEGKPANDPASILERSMKGKSASDVASPSDSEKLPEEAAFVPPANLHFLRMDARELPAVFSPGEVAKIYLNFSDPWPKARHEKRRLTSRTFLAIYEQVLADGGTLEFKTDNRDLFEFSVQEFEAADHWTITSLTRDLHADPVLNAGNIMTEYERKFSALGNKICKLTAVHHRDR